MSRPEILFPLFAELETLDGVGPKTAKLLPLLGVERPKDLLFLLPHSGISRARIQSVRDANLPDTVTVEVFALRVASFTRSRTGSEAGVVVFRAEGLARDAARTGDCHR